MKRSGFWLTLRDKDPVEAFDTGDSERTFRVRSTVHAGTKDATGRPAYLLLRPSEAVKLLAALAGKLTVDDLRDAAGPVKFLRGVVKMADAVQS